MPEDAAIRIAREFGQLAIENGLVDEARMQRLLAEHLAIIEQGRKPLPIEQQVVKTGVMSVKQANAVSTALSRIKRDKQQKEPNRIGGYEILGKLGVGGLGTVYRARQLSMRRKVALKVLHRKWLADTEFKSRFLLEARLAGKLSHQNLIQVYDVGRDGDLHYFSMEYVDGETVEDIIDRDGPMPMGYALDIITQILRALMYIQKFDIVHRDIKPGNIMLTRTGIAKLGDFGFVKSKFDSVLSQDGEVLGTPDYISPEQAMGEETIDFRSDIYSLGATLYHMLTGKPPFEGSVSDVMRKHIKASPVSIAELIPDLPESVMEMINKLMAKDPNDRYQTIQQVFDDLELIKAAQGAKGEQIHAGKSTIVRALKIEQSRLDRMRQDIQRLEMDTAMWKSLTIAGFTAAILLFIFTVVLALLYFKVI